MRKSNAKEWQTDPNSLETNMIQVWSDSGTYTGRVDRSYARKLIERGSCFVINEQAIGQYDLRVAGSNSYAEYEKYPRR
jgi:hypothetical protein